MVHFVQVAIELGIVLGIMVLVHELGHFIMAKLCGVRVETFSIGFGPRLVGWMHGGTDYRLSALPLGGYVKMAGDVPGEAPSGDPGEFNAHPRWQRVLIALAGPVSNFILAFVILLGLAMTHFETQQYLEAPAVLDYVPQNSSAAKAGLAAGDTVEQFDGIQTPRWQQIDVRCLLNLGRDLPITVMHDGQSRSTTLHITSNGSAEDFSIDDVGLLPREQSGPVKVVAVMPDTPARRAGLKAGDALVKVDNLAPHSAATLLAYLKDENGGPVVLTVLRNGNTIQLPITPEQGDVGLGKRQYRLGFQPMQPPVTVQKLSFFRAAEESWKANLNDSSVILQVLKGMFTRHVSVKSVSGPIGIAQQIDVATQMGWSTVAHLMSSISLNLGIFNLLPIPILDGGMILFLVIEQVMGRDVNQAMKERVYQVAFVCIVVFAAFVIFNDITKMLPGHTHP
jgi:regulator of sigma E protease